MARNQKITLCLIVMGALMVGGLALAVEPDDPPTPGSDCKFADLECPNDWAPVACKKGGWFQNRCYAKRACARACRNFFGG